MQSESHTHRIIVIRKPVKLSVFGTYQSAPGCLKRSQVFPSKNRTCRRRGERGEGP